MTLAAVLISIAVTAGTRIDNEGSLLETYGQVYRTDPETLIIETDKGETVTFRNEEDFEYGMDTAFYFLIDYLPEQNIWVVEMHGYEWMQWYLVNGSTGESTTTIGPATASPDGTRLLCFMKDIDAGFIDNGIQIWKITEDDGLELEFEDIDVPWGPVDCVWQTDEAISFTKWSYDWETSDYLQRPGKLTYHNGEWRRDDPADWE